MNNEQLTIRIILQSPPKNVQYGLQEGAGNQYKVIQSQLSAGKDLTFTCTIKVKTGKDGQPDFGGPYVNGPAGERFMYLDIGTAAGQTDSEWTRRLKVPLRDITWEMVNAPKGIQTLVPGTAKDGSPNCATVKPFAGWQIATK